MYISENLMNLDYIFGDLAYFKKKKINRIWKFKVNHLYKPNFKNTPYNSLKNIIQDLNLYEKFQIASVTDFLIKLCRNNYKYKKLDKFLIFMQSGGVSFSFKFK